MRPKQLLDDIKKVINVPNYPENKKDKLKIELKDQNLPNSNVEGTQSVIACYICRWFC